MCRRLVICLVRFRPRSNRISLPFLFAGEELLSKFTYARQLDAAVTALRGSAALLDVEDSELAAGGLDDTGPVGRRVVPIVMPPVSVDACSSNLCHVPCLLSCRIDEIGVWTMGERAKKRCIRMGSVSSLRTRCGDGRQLCCWPLLLFDVVGDVQ